MDAPTPLKIAEITSLIKEILEGAFPRSSSRARYQTSGPPAPATSIHLEGRNERDLAVMFRGKSRFLSFTPKDGLLVRATGSISVYEARGAYQIIIESMEESGSGDILRLLEERKRRLAAEGLFDEARKRPIPSYPERVAVVTSPTGAAIRDILQIIRRRNPGISVTVLPSPVQGTEAPPAIVRQIETANRYRMSDVIIVARGGGSLEDLLPSPTRPWFGR
jgi:exodeoxyribonuclease VII large subunit